MSFQTFSQDFLNKWLTQEDFDQYVTLNDKKVKAGINWLTLIQKSSFQRYDNMWLQLKEECIKCMGRNCKDDYEWIINNSEVTQTEDKFKTIRFKNKEIGKQGYEKLRNYNECKKQCYEKVNLMNKVLSRKFYKFNQDLNLCFVLCRGKPFDKENLLSDCYSDCFIKHSKMLPEIEYFIKKVYEQVINEYKENKFDTPNIDITHNHRFKQREFTPDLWSKYL